MQREETTIKIIQEGNYSEQEVEESKRNLLGWFMTLKKINDRLKNDRLNLT